jgi:hypothetical protein
MQPVPKIVAMSKIIRSQKAVPNKTAAKPAEKPDKRTTRPKHTYNVTGMLQTAPDLARRPSPEGYQVKMPSEVIQEIHKRSKSVDVAHTVYTRAAIDFFLRMEPEVAARHVEDYLERRRVEIAKAESPAKKPRKAKSR